MKTRRAPNSTGACSWTCLAWIPFFARLADPWTGFGASSRPNRKFTRTSARASCSAQMARRVFAELTGIKLKPVGLSNPEFVRQFRRPDFDRLFAFTYGVEEETLSRESDSQCVRVTAHSETTSFLPLWLYFSKLTLYRIVECICRIFRTC